MDLLTRLSWIDLAIIVLLAAGVFSGFTQGAIRYLVNCVAVLVAFVLAAQLKGPLVSLLGFWTAFTPAGRELLIFVLLFFGFLVAAWLAIRAVYRRTRLPVPRQLDELVGAVLGLLFVALLVSLHLVVYDSFFRTGGQTSGWVGAYYDALNSSLIIGFFRESLIPVAGVLVRPFVPDGIARLL